ncbi:hypothetical protein [Thiopseudomonas denitrificans]|nr:hypothetical protein [Thiopseudomonas denitrificans]
MMRHLRQLLQEESFYAMPGQSREVHALFTRIRLLAAGGEPQPATL